MTRRNILFLLLATCVLHGLILLNRGVFWDGWRIWNALTAGDGSELTTLFVQRGQPALAWFHLAMGQLPDIIVGYRLVVFVSLFFSALVTLHILRKHVRLDPPTSMAIVLLWLAYPPNGVLFELINAPYPLCYLLFLLGVLAYLEALGRPPLHRFALTMASVILIYPAFTLDSLLVFYGGLFVVLIRHQALLAKADGAGCIRRVVRHLPLLLVPVTYWMVKKWLTPSHGEGLGYNSLSWSVPEVGTHFVRNIYYSVLIPLDGALQVFVDHPLAAVSLMLVVLLAYPKWAPWTHADVGEERHNVRMLVDGAILLVAGILPYALVRKSSAPNGWDMRLAILTGLPLALLVAGLARMLVTQTTGGMRRGAVVVVTLVLVGLSSNLIGNHLGWHYRWVHDVALIHALSQASGPEREASGFLITDETPRFNLEGYRDSEWCALIREAWGPEQRSCYGHDSWRFRCLFTPEGEVRSRSACPGTWGIPDRADPLQVEVRVTPGDPQASHFRVLLQSWWYGVFDPGRLDDLYEDVVSVAFIPRTPAGP